MAGVRADATYLWSDGADTGKFAGERVPCFRKDLPVSEIGRALLVTTVNGEPLPARHGGPVRLVVPGFYGTNSVKWLWRLTLADRRADGLFTTRFYNDEMPDGTRRPVYGLAPESIVVWPAPAARIGRTATLRGWAWSGTPVVVVEVSIDEGATWQGAEVTGRSGREWQAWSARAAFDAPGRRKLMCRATDANGVMQPVSGARNEVHAVDVIVE